MAERRGKRPGPEKEDLRMEYKECGKDYRTNLVIVWVGTVAFISVILFFAYTGLTQRNIIPIYFSLGATLIWLFLFEGFYMANDKLKNKMRRLEGRKFLAIPGGIARFSRTGKAESYLFSINIIRWSIVFCWLVFLCYEIYRFLTLPRFRLP